MTPQKKLEEKPIPFCLFHEKVDCACIEPVTCPVKLRDRLGHFISLSQLQLKYNHSSLPAEILQQKIEQTQERLEKL